MKRSLHFGRVDVRPVPSSKRAAAEPGRIPCPNVEPEVTERLQATLDSTLAATGTMGVSVAVIMPDGKLWTGVSGLSHPGTPITTDMLFDMGSTGKNLMAALVLDLVDDGLLSLEDPISKYLPPFPNVDGRITIRQLLNHTSGLYMWVEHPDCPINTPFHQIDFDKVVDRGGNVLDARRVRHTSRRVRDGTIRRRDSNWPD